MRRSLTSYWLLLVAAGGTFAGCNEAPFDLAPVRGTVTLDGRPVTQGKVMFAPIRTGQGLEAGKPAIGLIQSDGSFKLSTYTDGDGAVIGEHWVTIFGPDPPSALKPSANPASEAGAEALKFERLSVTEKQVIKPGMENQIAIALTSMDLAKYSIHGE